MNQPRSNHQARLLSGVAGFALASLAAAHAEEAQFSIPPQPLDRALSAFGKQSGHPLYVDWDLVGKKKSPGFMASAEPEAALKKLLAGTGLSYRRDGEIFSIVVAQTQVEPVRLAVKSVTVAAAETVSGSAVEGLVVTAQKRRENIQDVPIAISAFTQDQLELSQIAGGPDLMTQVPNMTFTKTNFSSYSIQIRGIGTQAISATTDPAVAVAFNNTSFIRNHFFEQEFYDLERVEVLRGPQGTLYGRNATAGVVNVLSAKPSFIYETKASVDLANYDSRRIEGMVNFPLIADKAALRIAGAWTKREGFVTNTLTGQQTDGRDLWSGRITLGLSPAENFSLNLIYERFEENDDRLRSGKQLCSSDPGPAVVNGFPIPQEPAAIGGITAGYVSQGCKPASLYGEESFDTPNGFALGYYGPLAIVGSPTYFALDPYASKRQSRDLREIETHLVPEYEAAADVIELQMNFDLPGNLSLTSETGYSRDYIFSFEDYNRFDTTPGVFIPGAARLDRPEDYIGPGPYLDVVDVNGVFCDPQLGCTNRLAAGDLSTARSKQFSQEFRLSSDFDGPFNFSVGANFLRYDNEDKYYVFINTITAFQAVVTDQLGFGPWIPGVTDNSQCLEPPNFFGDQVSDPAQLYIAIGCGYVDPNDIHHLNDQGRNYFLSKNPYHLLSYAAFGEAYWNVTPELKLTAGLRWTVDRKTAPQIPTWLLANDDVSSVDSSYGLPVYKVINQEWQEPTGRLAVDWKPDLAFTDDTLVYASYVRGYKAGGANPPPPVLSLATQCPPQCDDYTIGSLINHYLTHPETFDAEYVDAFELGTKNTFFDGLITANLSGFYYDYRGYQISQIIDRSALNFNFDATVKGLELEVDWQPLENLRFGFKGGYEDTRVADGEQAIDTMDRTAGKEGWMVYRPFPTLPSNCVVPTWLAIVGTIDDHNPIPSAVCSAYLINLDPVTFLPYVPNPTEYRIYPPPPGYPGYDPANANNGQGFPKDLSGNELPNAPKYTATITADYTYPLTENWLMTLHTDLYYQSEAWARIFNTDGYDKIKAYNNINFAAIFANEDAGWQVMAYVKNLLDRDSITGAFLNSDDTGLTTNIFLTEPRLYGVRVSKNWSGIPFWKQGEDADKVRDPNKPYLFTLELGEQIQRIDAPGEKIMPLADAFSSTLDPRHAYDKDMDWTDGLDAKLTYRPEDSAWKASANIRYGRTDRRTTNFRKNEVSGPTVCNASEDAEGLPFAPNLFSVIAKLSCDPDYGPVYYQLQYNGYDLSRTLENKYQPENMATPLNRVGAKLTRQEEHLLVDFAVGKDIGIGALGDTQSSLNAGVRIAEFESTFGGDMRGISDLYVPEGWNKYDSSFNHHMASFEGERKFKGVGPILSWEASTPVLGDADAGHVNVDWTTTGGVLFGKQKMAVSGMEGSDYYAGRYRPYPEWAAMLQPVAQTPFSYRRSKSVAVPVVDLSLGLSYAVQGIKLSTGYRWERYFGVMDGGFEAHKSYDRTIDGPYVKMALGFGG